jgi:hypothetical protein
LVPASFRKWGLRPICVARGPPRLGLLSSVRVLVRSPVLHPLGGLSSPSRPRSNRSSLVPSAPAPRTRFGVR